MTDITISLSTGQEHMIRSHGGGELIFDGALTGKMKAALPKEKPQPPVGWYSAWHSDDSRQVAIEHTDSPIARWKTHTGFRCEWERVQELYVDIRPLNLATDLRSPYDSDRVRQLIIAVRDAMDCTSRMSFEKMKRVVDALDAVDK